MHAFAGHVRPVLAALQEEAPLLRPADPSVHDPVPGPAGIGALDARGHALPRKPQDARGSWTSEQALPRHDIRVRRTFRPRQLSVPLFESEALTLGRM